MAMISAGAARDNALLGLFDFLRIGQEQWLVQSNILAAIIYRLIGPLSIHCRIRNAFVFNKIAQQKLPEASFLLDAGSGHGYASLWLAQRYPGFKVTGVEIDGRHVENSRYIASALGLDNVEFLQADLSSLDDSEKYDLVFSIDVLEHIEDDGAVLRNLYRALKFPGTLVLHVPLRHQLQRRFLRVFEKHAVDDHVRDEYTEDEIVNKVQDVGFHVSGVTYGFDRWGELAFEINNLFWDIPFVRYPIALMTLPFTLPMAYFDVILENERGNSLIVEAVKGPIA